MDTALTIHARLVHIPEAERLLLEMDSTFAKDENPFQFSPSPASHCVEGRELQGTCNVVLRHIADIVTHLAMSASSADFSVEGLRGSPQTGNRGLVDTILLKKEALGYLCLELPVQLGIEGDATWLSDLRASLADHSSHLASRKIGRAHV